MRQGARISGGGGGFPPIPPVTRTLLFLLVGLSLLNVFAARWLNLGSPAEYLALAPGLVLRGQAWRLLTYPWIELSPLSLVISGYLFYRYGGEFEVAWGRRGYIRRLALLVGVPAVLIALLSVAVRPLQGADFLGMSALWVALITVFASQLGGRQITLFPFPFVLSGDGILYLVGGGIGLGIIFSGSVLGLLPELFSFGFALAWFRFGLFQGWRRRWLTYRRARLEARLKRLRRQRGLRVVEEEEEEGEPRRWLN